MWQDLFFRVRHCMLAMLVLVSMPLTAEDKINIPLAKRPPVLSDYIAGVPADAGIEVSGFRQFAPGDGEPSALETKVYFSYDEDNFYAVFVCKDDPSLVRARIARREDLIGDDAVQLYIDSFHDQQRAFRFLVNPYGVQMDAKQTEGIGPDFDYDTQWQSDGQITDDGYVVLMSIPFTSLRFDNSSVQDWGIAVGRIIPRLNEFSHWPYITQRKEAFIPQFATAEINAEISPGQNIQVIPYAYLADSRALNSRDPANPFWENTTQNEVGLDAKFVLADSFAVDVTLNPDFSEVEADEPQVIIDKRFEVLFPEKRPFFLENAGFFNTPKPLFFSRRILDPEYGARITGRTGDWSIGGLLINDEAAGNFLAPNDPNYGKKGEVAVARVQSDFGIDSNIGVLLTSRNVGNRSNYVNGIDSRFKINENWVLKGQFAASRSTQTGLEDRNGRLTFIEAKRGGRNFNYTGDYLDVSSKFNTELGFVPRTDIKQTNQTATYLWNFPDAEWMISAGPTLSTKGIWDHDGKLQERATDAYFSVNGLRATTFEAHWLDGYERYSGIGFDKSGYSLAATTEWFSWLTATVTAGQNEVINYWPAAGIQPFIGDAKNVSLNLKLTPFDQLRIEQTLFWNDLSTQEAIGGFDSGTNVYRNTLSRTKFSYQYSRFLAGHLILDYNALDANNGLIALPENKKLNIDIQMSYVLSPGTAIYFGYTDRQENVRLVGNPAILERTQDLDLHTGKQIFVKFSYLFQY